MRLRTLPIAARPLSAWLGVGVVLLGFRFAGYRTTVSEQEPNNTIALAQLVAHGDTIAGVINRSPGAINDDVDVFAVDLDAGAVIDFDLLSARAGTFLEANLSLIDDDGTFIAGSNRAEGYDPRLLGVLIRESGRYYVRVSPVNGSSPDYHYTLALGTALLGPGDPTETRPGVPLETAWHGPALTGGPAGEVYLVAPGENGPEKNVWRVDPNGSELVAETDGNAFDVVLDAMGDLLLPEPEHHRILRVSPRTGNVSVFWNSAEDDELTDFIPIFIAVDASGVIWVTGARFSDLVERVLRFDRWGRRLSATPLELGSASVTSIAVSPDGILHYTDNFDGVYRVTAAGEATLVHADQSAYGIAFGEDGSIYITRVQLGVRRLSADYLPLDDPFAVTELRETLELAFLRDASGSITNRLVGNTSRSLVELDAAGVPAAGSAPTLGVVTPAQAAQHLMGGAPLATDTVEGLDYRGNDNGQLDVGDLSSLVASY